MIEMVATTAGATGACSADRAVPGGTKCGVAQVPLPLHARHSRKPAEEEGAKRAPLQTVGACRQGVLRGAATLRGGELAADTHRTAVATGNKQFK